MKKIGFLYGSARNFPEAVIRRINQTYSNEALAEPIVLTQVLTDHQCLYDVVIDLISHQIPFYNSYLKQLTLQGIPVYNNPKTQMYHDHFYQHNIIASLGYKVPKAALLPSYHRPNYTNDYSFTNLSYPFNWQAIIDYVGFPASIKLNHQPSTQQNVVVHSLQELWDYQHTTGSQVTFLQEVIHAEAYYSCYSIGERQYRIIAYDPSKPPHLRYAVPTVIASSLEKQLISQARRINRSLGYDLNCLQFAICNQVPYVVDAFHIAMNEDIYTLGPDHFEWLVATSAQWAISKTAPKKTRIKSTLPKEE